MEQYIPKSALMAEFNRLIAELVEKGEDTMFEQGRISAFEDTKLFLDTLEMKGVDLEKEIQTYKDNHSYMSEYIRDVAKHFFELGVSVSNKAQKGE